MVTEVNQLTSRGTGGGKSPELVLHRTQEQSRSSALYPNCVASSKMSMANHNALVHAHNVQRYIPYSRPVHTEGLHIIH